MADLYGLDFRRRLRSADRLSDLAISFGLLVKTRRSRVRASLSRVTRCDQRLLFFTAIRSQKKRIAV